MKGLPKCFSLSLHRAGQKLRGFFVVYHRPCLVRDTTLWCVLTMGVGYCVEVIIYIWLASSHGHTDILLSWEDRLGGALPG